MPEALEAIFPRTTLQTCVVHLIRHSLEYASYRDRRPLALALRAIYTAPTVEAAAAALDAFAASPLGARFPTVTAAWRRGWTHVVPFFAFPPAIRRVLCVSNCQFPRPIQDSARESEIRDAQAAGRVRSTDAEMLELIRVDTRTRTCWRFCRTE
jgi:transposase-like protein